MRDYSLPWQCSSPHDLHSFLDTTERYQQAVLSDYLSAIMNESLTDHLNDAPLLLLLLYRVEPIPCKLGPHWILPAGMLLGQRVILGCVLTLIVMTERSLNVAKECLRF